MKKEVILEYLGKNIKLKVVYALYLRIPLNLKYSFISALLMANIVYFEIPADDVNRAKRFYQSFLGWKIEPTKVSIPDMASMQYQDIITGEPNEAPMGSLSTGGMYKRQMNEPSSTMLW